MIEPDKTLMEDPADLIAEIEAEVGRVRGKERDAVLVVLITEMASMLLALHRKSPRLTYIAGARVQEVTEIPGGTRPFTVMREVTKFLKGGLD